MYSYCNLFKGWLSWVIYAMSLNNMPQLFDFESLHGQNVCNASVKLSLPTLCFVQFLDTLYGSGEVTAGGVGWQ